MSKNSDTKAAPSSSSEAISKDSQPQDQNVKPQGKPQGKPLEYQDIGVWTTMRERRVSWKLPGHSILTGGKDLIEMLPFVYCFFQDCFSVGPLLLTAYSLASLWSSIESAVGLYFSSHLLDLIQDSVLKRRVERKALFSAVLFRIGFTLVSSVIARIRRKARSILASRIRYLFDGRLLKANLRLDLPTFEEPETGAKINRLLSSYDRGSAWRILDGLLDRLTVITSIISQISFVFRVLRSQPGSMWFVVICLSKSMVRYTTLSDSWWRTPSYSWASNVHYRRLSSLVQTAFNKEHRLEVVSNGLAGYIQREWRKAQTFLRDVSDDHPSSVIHAEMSFAFTFLDDIVDDFPSIFYAYQVVVWPGSFSLTSVALVQQATKSLAWTISKIINEPGTLMEHLNDIKGFYETSHIRNTLQDGKLEYPQDCNKALPGMDISFENVSFAYPNAEEVIKEVSFTIRRGETVIIVGANGSGKSTLLKLFNRVYDPTMGTISVDGVPMQSFKANGLRRASAMLFQTYSHFPLSIRENIALGLPDEEFLAVQDDVDPVAEAARLGGADVFVRAKKDGFDTVLKPYHNAWSTGGIEHLGEPFKKRMNEIDKRHDVSHGQWQRLALSRLFFRAAGKDIKLVAVDEPSASLDPEMEYELFESLKHLSTKRGKTMIFVTHRFGHLTKQADLILVMQNGRLVEQGKHDQLIKAEGEYAKLYKLQANAFLPNTHGDQNDE